jgi:hypothetical protein
MQKKILLIGDSFSTSNHKHSWATQINNATVDNLSSNGSSEYRIVKKLMSVDLSEYDFAIIVHTSPNRIYVRSNPVHENSESHPTCDLIYQDIKSADSNKFTDNVSWWFEHIFDLEYANDIHNILIEKSRLLLTDCPSLHLTFFDLDNHPNLNNLHHVWKKYPGDINHLSKDGNVKVAEFINKQLQ